MFLLNSRLGLCSAASSRRHPFSRSYGVILPSSLTRVLPFVSGFSPRPPASVSGTGALRYTSNFSRQRELSRFPTLFRSRMCPASRFAYFTTTRPLLLHGLYHQPAHAILLCQCLTCKGGTGISTSYPSPTTIVLGLGPDLPWADEPSPGNLGLSTCKFLAYISLLIPAFSLLCRPRLLPVPLLPAYDAPLPLHIVQPEASVVCFSPGHLRRTITRPVSYYALFE